MPGEPRRYLAYEMLIAEIEFDCDQLASEALNHALGSASQQCKCVACKNFLANRSALFAKPKLSELLHDLGLTDPLDNQTSFAAQNGSEALYGTTMYVVGQSNLPMPSKTETTTFNGFDVSMSDGVAVHPLDDGVSLSFSRTEKLLASEFSNDAIHELELQVFLPWIVNAKMPDFNPHL